MTTSYVPELCEWCAKLTNVDVCTRTPEAGKFVGAARARLLRRILASCKSSHRMIVCLICVCWLACACVMGCPSGCARGAGPKSSAPSAVAARAGALPTPQARELCLVHTTTSWAAVLRKGTVSSTAGSPCGGFATASPNLDTKWGRAHACAAPAHAHAATWPSSPTPAACAARAPAAGRAAAGGHGGGRRRTRTSSGLRARARFVRALSQCVAPPRHSRARRRVGPALFCLRLRPWWGGVAVGGRPWGNEPPSANRADCDRSTGAMEGPSVYNVRSVAPLLAR